MSNLKYLSVIYFMFSVLIAVFATLEHQWVYYDATSGEIQSPLDELPVLHTAFVQTGEELHYFSESGKVESDMVMGHRVQSEVSAGGGGGAKLKEKNYNVHKQDGENSLPIEFDPPFLDFGDSAVGSSLKKRVFLRSHLHRSIILDSIGGATVNFHTSFFNIVEIPPLGSAFFDVAFLPRDEGNANVAINIRTSIGTFIYELSGRSSSNPYRIAPFVGTRLPFNGTIFKDVTLHNPFASTFRISEVMSSGGNLHIEMPYDIDGKVAGEPLEYWVGLKF